MDAIILGFVVHADAGARQVIERDGIELCYTVLFMTLLMT